MAASIKLACDSTVLRVPIEHILPIRVVPENWKKGRKYQCIAASVRELGVIEPLAFFLGRRAAPNTSCSMVMYDWRS
jgi:hypothetical protein